MSISVILIRTLAMQLLGWKRLANEEALNGNADESPVRWGTWRALAGYTSAEWQRETKALLVCSDAALFA